MAFQINEKMMAHNRAIITRNQTDRDLLGTDPIKFKPGMAHYISENQKLWLSVEPKRLPDNSIRTLLEVITDVRLSNILLDYVNRDGGSNNSMRGQLHSIVPTGTAPFITASTTKVNNLNVDRVDDMHVSVNTLASSIVGRDSSGNININTILNFNTNRLMDSETEIAIKRKDGTAYTNLSIATLDSSTGILRANNSVNKGIIEWKNDVWCVGVNGATSEVVTKSLYGHGLGIDADTVDNRHVDDSRTDTSSLWTSKKINDSKAPRGFGLGLDLDAIPSNNCNSITGTGFFSGVNPTNGVAGETGEALIQTAISGTSQFQTIEYTVSKNMYTRFKVNGVWSSWNKSITGSNVFDEGINIVLQSTQPQNITNDNTYWYEII